MNHLKNIVRWIVNVLTCFLLVILVLVIYGKCVLTFTDKFYPNYLGYTFFEVASGSMEPALYVGDVIIVNITKKDLNKGDIIAFVSENKAVITHRILFVDGDIITVKGDNNNTIDTPINRASVIGKVVKVFPKFGVWKKVITEPKVLVTIFVTLLLFDFALSYNGKEKGNSNKEIEVQNAKNDKKKMTDKVEKPVETLKKDEKENKKDIIESGSLLELTRKIDIEEINKLLEEENRLSKKEINNLKNTIDDVNNTGKKEIEVNKKEKKFIEYTMRLELKEIQKKIKSKVK